MSYSEAMGKAVNFYKSRCYLDSDGNDIFICPKCKDNISPKSGDIIKFQCPDCNKVYYKCPLCGKWF